MWNMWNINTNRLRKNSYFLKRKKTFQLISGLIPRCFIYFVNKTYTELKNKTYGISNKRNQIYKIIQIEKHESENIDETNIVHYNNHVKIKK